uniref:Uncharacterized protein n=1 Tax=Aegilops tauschii TaxID=37682 RepID=M8BV40_AEGTA
MAGRKETTLDLAKFVDKGVQLYALIAELFSELFKLNSSSRHAPMLPSLWSPDARQAVDAPDLKTGRATPAAPAPAMLNFAPGQLPQVFTLDDKCVQIILIRI